MLGKVVFLCAIGIIAVKCQPNPQDIQDCMKQIDSRSPAPTDKMGCVHACLGQKEGWLNGDGSLNIEKKLEMGSKHFSGDNLTNFKNAVNKCKDAANGQTDVCVMASKLKECMMANNAPPPPGPPGRK